MGNQYQTEEEINAVVLGFESCSTAKDKFTHREHLTVAVWYLHNSNEAQALQKMRSGLFRFLDHHGVGRGKYKETLTVSWIKLIQSTVAQMDTNLSLVEITNLVLEKLGDPRMVSEYDSEANFRDAEEGPKLSKAK
jgi:hypothetical protein